MTIRFSVLFVLLLVLAACAQGSTEIAPPEIHFGEDVCAECDMIISDVRFAAGYAYEIEPGRYESLAFDDIGDMLIHADKHPEHKVVAWYVHDFDSSEILDATNAHYMFSNQLPTPMGQGTAAYVMLATAEHMAAEMDGEVLDWDGLVAKHRARELMVSAVAGNAQEHVHDHGEAPIAEHQAHQHDQMTVLGTIEKDGYSIELVAERPLQTGFNPVMIHVTDADGEPVEAPEFTLAPMMAMYDGKNHAAAVEQPVSEMAGMAHGAVAFPMPSGPDLGTWTLDVAMQDLAANALITGSLALNVAPGTLSGSLLTPDERKIFLAVVSPIVPGVGAQPLEIYAYERIAANEWPALDSLSLTITPEMPSMGHGSPNNEDPVSVGAGHYVGVVNFSMAGPWTVTVTVSDGGTVMGDVVLSYEVAP